MIPASLLCSVEPWQIVEDYGYSLELVRFRARVWRLWGF